MGVAVGLFRCIVADPPWLERGGGKVKRGADRHYKLMKTYKIIETMLRASVWMPVEEGSHLYLFATNTYLANGDAHFVMKALGFRCVTVRTWAKTLSGIGQYYSGQTEHILFGVRGRLPPIAKIAASTLVGRGLVPRVKDENGKDIHSRKPQEFYDEVERVSPGPYLEMFAREPREGWTVFGNEVAA